MDADIIVVSLSPVCDFCSSRGIVVAYLIEDFVLPQYQWGSSGAFAACGICRDLVEGGRVRELEERAVRTFSKLSGMEGFPEQVTRTFVRDLHTEFWLRLRCNTLQ